MTDQAMDVVFGGSDATAASAQAARAANDPSRASQACRFFSFERAD